MAQLGRGQPQPAIVSRGSLADAPVLTTPPPKVIQAAPTPGFGKPNAGLTVRNSLADPPVLTTPQPVVVAQPVRWPPTFPLISSAPLIIPPPPVTYGTARQAVMTIPAAVAGQMPLPHAEGGKQ